MGPPSLSFTCTWKKLRMLAGSSTLRVTLVHLAANKDSSTHILCFVTTCRDVAQVLLDCHLITLPYISSMNTKSHASRARWSFPTDRRYGLIAQRFMRRLSARFVTPRRWRSMTVSGSSHSNTLAGFLLMSCDVVSTTEAKEGIM